jgi:steroid 5-alpha reductase family enzyme
MAVALLDAVVFFLVGLIVSTIIIYVITKVFGEKEGVGTAVLAALVGAVIYALAYYFIGQGLVAALIAGFVWLLALAGLYSMGWWKALGVAIVVWIVAFFVGYILPTVVGPL